MRFGLSIGAVALGAMTAGLLGTACAPSVDVDPRQAAGGVTGTTTTAGVGSTGSGGASGSTSGTSGGAGGLSCGDVFPTLADIGFDGPACAPAVLSVPLGGIGPPTGMAADSAGNAIIVGGSGDGPALPMFLSKYDPSGAIVWTRTFGGLRARRRASIAIGPGDEILVTGYVDEPADLGNGVVVDPAGGEMVLAKLASDGHALWARSFGSFFDLSHLAIAFDPAGGFVLGGNFVETLDLGAGPLISAGADDAFVARFDAQGNALWSRRFGDADERQGVHALASTPTGEIVMIGHFRSTIDFGGGPLPSAGGDDIFVAAVDVDGQHLWSKAFGGLDHGDHAVDVAVGSGGEIVMTGSIGSAVDFGGGPLAHTGYADLFVTKLSASGHHVWSRSYGLALGADSGTAVSIDIGGRVRVGAFIMWGEHCNWIPRPLLLELDADGFRGCASLFMDGSYGSASPEGLAPAPGGGFYMAGRVHGGSIDLGAGPLDTSGFDGFLARFAP